MKFPEITYTKCLPINMFFLAFMYGLMAVLDNIYAYVIICIPIMVVIFNMLKCSNEADEYYKLKQKQNMV